ncbi:DNA repair protein recA homolog 2, mitochondrial-like isoform X2 [Macadamia integrifolia]|uniref:DNA repair protein recA homolog 2, mitochondrial-like isoform X2 n=1 Tax=Macadamia integrifolia TaxID=60698 RepID=UPI001C4FE386|nr:DNA repair protein recA homolog 2, mitochondrial-like isoform X2 [Macadamia integrifolia]
MGFQCPCRAGAKRSSASFKLLASKVCLFFFFLQEQVKTSLHQVLGPILLLGRIVEIYGQEASGKTTLALHIIKEAQRLGGYCAYIDVENAMVASLAESIGVDTDNLLIAGPDFAENSFKVIDTLAKSGSIDVIVVDSVAALVSECELGVLMDTNLPDVQSRLMTRALRKIQYSLVQSQTLLVFINQVRSNLRSYHGFRRTKEVSCGGNALKFYSAVRLRILRRGLLKNESEQKQQQQQQQQTQPFPI